MANEMDAFIEYSKSIGLEPSRRPVEGSAEAWAAWQEMTDDEREPFRVQARGNA